MVTLTALILAGIVGLWLKLDAIAEMLAPEDSTVVGFEIPYEEPELEEEVP